MLKSSATRVIATISCNSVTNKKVLAAPRDVNAVPKVPKFPKIVFSPVEAKYLFIFRPNLVAVD